MNNAELIKALRSFDVCESCPCEHPEMCENADCIVIQAADLIEAQAKRIAELEAQLPKEGEWVWENYYWHCSACGENPTRGMGYVQGKNELFRVCPNCGARMKGEQE